LEIKCPSSRRDCKIIDREKQESLVKYLIFDEGNVKLKRNHQYYTQVQVSMYILGIDICHFVVYSSSDYVHLVVPRDESFLLEVIPKIEHFYYSYFINLLPAP